MNDMPGLSRPLADAGKRVDSWDDAGGHFVLSNNRIFGNEAFDLYT
jgi:hypothetical protein